METQAVKWTTEGAVNRANLLPVFCDVRHASVVGDIIGILIRARFVRESRWHRGNDERYPVLDRGRILSRAIFYPLNERKREESENE